VLLKRLLFANINKRSVLSTSIAALESSKDDAEDGPLVLQQVTRSLNDASGNRYHRRKPFTSLLYRQSKLSKLVAELPFMRQPMLTRSSNLHGNCYTVPQNSNK
jgi:hypothetical protein